MDPAVIIAIVSTAVVQLGAVLGVAWTLGGRLARLETRLDGLVGVRECERNREHCWSECPARENTDPHGCRPVRMAGGA
ncbi:MAG: hypothetical protein MUC88_23260 [Planctomycetes bacterium]|jgi:hypothetical protein|nr:hypothetical protein [Planctomycetota bacterium]